MSDGSNSKRDKRMPKAKPMRHIVPRTIEGMLAAIAVLLFVAVWLRDRTQIDGITAVVDKLCHAIWHGEWPSITWIRSDTVPNIMYSTAYWFFIIIIAALVVKQIIRWIRGEPESPEASAIRDLAKQQKELTAAIQTLVGEIRKDRESRYGKQPTIDESEDV